MKNKKILLLFSTIAVASLAGCASTDEDKTNSNPSDDSGGEVKPVKQKYLEKDAVISDGEDASKSKIVAHSLLIDDPTNLVYYVENGDVEFDSKGLLVWTSSQETYDFDSAEFKIESTETVSNADVYVFDKLAAKEMTIYVYAVSYIKVEDTYYYSKLDRYSIIEYCLSKKGSSSRVQVDETKTLGQFVEETINAGAEAQITNNFNISRLANDSFFNVTAKNAVFDDGFVTRLCTSSDKGILKSPNGESGFWMVDGEIDEENYTGSTFTPSELNKDCEVSFYSSNNYCRVSFDMKKGSVIQKDSVTVSNILIVPKNTQIVVDDETIQIGDVRYSIFFDEEEYYFYDWSISEGTYELSENLTISPNITEFIYFFCSLLNQYLEEKKDVLFLKDYDAILEEIRNKELELPACSGSEAEQWYDNVLSSIDLKGQMRTYDIVIYNQLLSDISDYIDDIKEESWKTSFEDLLNDLTGLLETFINANEFHDKIASIDTQFKQLKGNHQGYLDEKEAVFTTAFTYVDVKKDSMFKDEYDGFIADINNKKEVSSPLSLQNLTSWLNDFIEEVDTVVSNFKQSFQTRTEYISEMNSFLDEIEYDNDSDNFKTNLSDIISNITDLDKIVTNYADFELGIETYHSSYLELKGNYLAYVKGLKEAVFAEASTFLLENQSVLFVGDYNKFDTKINDQKNNIDDLSLEKIQSWLTDFKSSVDTMVSASTEMISTCDSKIAEIDQFISLIDDSSKNSFQDIKNNLSKIIIQAKSLAGLHADFIQAYNAFTQAKADYIEGQQDLMAPFFTQADEYLLAVKNNLLFGDYANYENEIEDVKENAVSAYQVENWLAEFKCGIDLCVEATATALETHASISSQMSNYFVLNSDYWIGLFNDLTSQFTAIPDNCLTLETFTSQMNSLKLSWDNLVKQYEEQPFVVVHYLYERNQKAYDDGMLLFDDYTYFDGEIDELSNKDEMSPAEFKTLADDLRSKLDARIDSTVKDLATKKAIIDEIEEKYLDIVDTDYRNRFMAIYDELISYYSSYYYLHSALTEYSTEYNSLKSEYLSKREGIIKDAVDYFDEYKGNLFKDDYDRLLSNLNTKKNDAHAYTLAELNSWEYDFEQDVHGSYLNKQSSLGSYNNILGRISDEKWGGEEGWSEYVDGVYNSCKSALDRASNYDDFQDLYNYYSGILSYDNDNNIWDVFDNLYHFIEEAYEFLDEYRYDLTEQDYNKFYNQIKDKVKHMYGCSEDNMDDWESDFESDVEYTIEEYND